MYVVVVLLSLLISSCAKSETEAQEFVASDGPDFPTEIRAARALGKLDVTIESVRVVGVECGVCHADGVDPAAALRADELDEFHLDMEFGHGELSCNSCHNPQSRATLRLADGTTLPFERTFDLCAQCHGPQSRDYRRGSHGGMTGYWDKKRGPRVRNHCVNCHDPHSPAYPTVTPAPPPKDRFLKPPEKH